MDRLLDALPIAIYVVGIACEHRWAARRYPAVRWWRTTCIAFSLGCGLVAIGVRDVMAHVIGAHHLIDGAALGVWAIPLGVATLTFLTYWMHRMVLHRVDFAFRWMHQLHHSAERVDVFGANFGHPLQVVLQGALIALVYQLGFGLPHVDAAIVTALLVFMNTFQHMNIRTPHWVGYIVQRPESHNIHHQRGLHARNYCDLPLWDIVFGTLDNPRGEHDVEVGYYDLASRRIGAMLFGRDITAPP